MISVIVPVYNADKTIKSTVESIINQTYKDIEVLLIDDGSSDRSFEICNALSIEDNRVKVIHQENKGASVARNVGINSATGEWVFFADADDTIPCDAFENLINIYNNSSSDNIELIVGCNYPLEHKVININFKIISPIKLIKATLNPMCYYQNLKSIVDVNIGGVALSPPWGKLIKRKVLVENNILFPIGVVHHEDTVFCLKLFTTIKTVLLTNVNCYFYNNTSNSISVRFNKNRISDMIYAINNAGLLYEKDLSLSEDIDYFILKRVLDCFFGFVTHKDNKLSITTTFSRINDMLTCEYVLKTFKGHRISFFINNSHFKFAERVSLVLIKIKATLFLFLFCKMVAAFKH